MYLFRVLVVDDEPAIVDEITRLLEEQNTMDLDVCFAYRGTDALEILQEGRIDLLITDIQMPQITGLTLMQHVCLLWPECKLIVLTGYSNFDYAYEAMKLNVFSYILKTEPDHVLLEIVHQAIDAIRHDMRYCSLAFQLPPYPDEHAPNPNEQFLLFYANCVKNLDTEAYYKLKRLFAFYFADSIRHIKLIAMESQSITMLFSLELKHSNEFAFLNSVLERVQTAFCEVTTLSLSFAAMLLSAENDDPSAALSRLKTELSAINSAIPIVTIVPQIQDESRYNIVRFLKEYIHHHIREELSLLKLSGISGYSADYLSKVFRRETGITLSRYIASQRLAEIRILMQNQESTLEDISHMTGFSSRAYFNHFVKKETGKSPQNYRRSLTL